MNRFLFLMYFFCGAMIATEVTQYKAKYQFDSEEISISGIREFKKNNDGYELKFRASNIVASMFFISEFDIDEVGVRSNSYQIKIRPKFLKRDQLIEFDRQENIIKSSGRNTWKSSFISDEITVDPLNAQIMIRKFIKENVNQFSLNLINMQEGGIETYNYSVSNNIKCDFNNEKYNCVVLDRIQPGSTRKTTYYLAEELDYMFLKIIDESEEWTNKLELKEILSFG